MDVDVLWVKVAFERQTQQSLPKAELISGEENTMNLIDCLKELPRTQRKQIAGESLITAKDGFEARNHFKF